MSALDRRYAQESSCAVLRLNELDTALNPYEPFDRIRERCSVQSAALADGEPVANTGVSYSTRDWQRRLPLRRRDR